MHDDEGASTVGGHPEEDEWAKWAAEDTYQWGHGTWADPPPSSSHRPTAAQATLSHNPPRKIRKPNTPPELESMWYTNGDNSDEALMAAFRAREASSRERSPRRPLQNQAGNGMAPLRRARQGAKDDWPRWASRHALTVRAEFPHLHEEFKGVRGDGCRSLAIYSDGSGYGMRWGHEARCAGCSFRVVGEPSARDAEAPRALIGAAWGPVCLDPSHWCFVGACGATNFAPELAALAEALLWLILDAGSVPCEMLVDCQPAIDAALGSTAARTHPQLVWLLRDLWGHREVQAAHLDHQSPRPCWG